MNNADKHGPSRTELEQEINSILGPEKGALMNAMADKDGYEHQIESVGLQVLVPRATTPKRLLQLPTIGWSPVWRYMAFSVPVIAAIAFVTVIVTQSDTEITSTTVDHALHVGTTPTEPSPDAGIVDSAIVTSVQKSPQITFRTLRKTSPEASQPLTYDDVNELYSRSFVDAVVASSQGYKRTINMRDSEIDLLIAGL